MQNDSATFVFEPEVLPCRAERLAGKAAHVYVRPPELCSSRGVVPRCDVVVEGAGVVGQPQALDDGIVVTTSQHLAIEAQATDRLDHGFYSRAV